MRKSFSFFLSFGLVISLMSIAPAKVGAQEDVKTYDNCSALNKVYPGGVAKAANVKNKGGKTKYKPFVSQKLYLANTKSDRDKDLIACEK
ncbi:MAG: excalibur calcium-binding domain-containing protein [Paenisporosarcina sp.]